MNAEPLIAELPRLFEDLERAGFEVTVQTRLAVHDLLLRLTVEGSLPSDRDAMRRMIGPIVCKSPSQQTQFASLFLQWQEQSAERSDDSHQETPPTEASVPPTPTQASKSGRPILTGCVMAAAIVLAVWINERRYEEHRSSVDFAPLSHLDSTDVQSEPIADQNARDQAADARSTHQQDDERSLAENGQDANTTKTNADDGPEEPAIDPNRDVPVETKNRAETHAVSSKPRFVVAAVVTGSGLLLACFSVCGWWALRARLRKRFLVKRSVNRDPQIEQLSVQYTTPHSQIGSSFIHTAQRFRQHLSRSSHRLDINRTAARTAAQGGLFTPVRAEQKVSPSYLMLIESDGRLDQQTQMIDNLVDQLEREGVAVTRYYFRGDPRICQPRDGRAQKLAELAASHNSDRLLVFADAKSFLDPMTGSVSPWVEAFESWPERALMVAAESENWSSAEAAMSEHFRLAPANLAGLSSLVDGFSPDPDLMPRIGDDRFPAMLREHPERWLDREAPSQESLNQLLAQLRSYLGQAGYQWLGACAVYPTLHNRLTLWTGESISDKDNRPLVNDSDLMRLTRLPWLRQGQLPDWLRARLIAELSREQELAIRNRLDELFRSSLQQPDAGTTLPIARETATSPQDHRNRGRLVRDHTFISFMSNPLSVRLPRALGHMLPFQQDWQPLRTLAVVSILGTLFATSAFMLAPAGQATISKPRIDDRPGEPRKTEGDSDATKLVNRQEENEARDGDDDIQLSVRARIPNTVVVVGDEVRLSVDVVNEGNVVIPATAAIDVRYVGPFEPRGFLDTLKGPVPPGESRTLQFPGIAAQMNGDFAIEVNLYADSARKQLLAESRIESRAYPPISAGIPLLSAASRKAADIQVAGPTQATVGERVKFKIVVTNSGGKPLKDVSIRNTFDQGLKHLGPGRSEYELWQTEGLYSPAEQARINAALNRPADAPLVSTLAGHHPIKKNIGELAPGDSRYVAVQFRAGKSGEFCQTLQVIDGDEEISATKHCLSALDADLDQEVSYDDPGWLKTAKRFADEARRELDLGNTDRAIELAERVLTSYEDNLGGEHAETDQSRIALAQLYQWSGDYAKAESLYQQSLVTSQKVKGQEHPDTAERLTYLAALYGAMGDHARAEPLFKQALQIRRKTLGTEHPDTATSFSNLGLSYLKLGDFAKAEPLLKQALEIRRKTLGEAHPETEISRQALTKVRTLREAKRFESSRQVEQRTIPLLPNDREPTGAPPALPRLPITDRAQQTIDHLPRASSTPPIPLPGEQRMIPSTAGELDPQQRPLR